MIKQAPKKEKGLPEGFTLSLGFEEVFLDAICLRSRLKDWIPWKMWTGSLWDCHTAPVGCNEDLLLQLSLFSPCKKLSSFLPRAYIDGVCNSVKQQDIIPLLLQLSLHIYPCCYLWSGKGSLNTDEVTWNKYKFSFVWLNSILPGKQNKKTKWSLKVLHLHIDSNYHINRVITLMNTYKILIIPCCLKSLVY